MYFDNECNLVSIFTICTKKLPYKQKHQFRNKIVNGSKVYYKFTEIKSKLYVLFLKFFKTYYFQNKKISYNFSNFIFLQLGRKMSKSNVQSSSGSTSDSYHDFRNNMKLDYRL